MRKRVSGIILAAVLTVTQTFTAFAAGSRTADVALAGDSVSCYKLMEASEDIFRENGVKDEAVLDMIIAVNAGTKTLEDLAAELAPDLKGKLSDKEMITPFFDLIPVNGGRMTEEGKYTVTLSVPTVTEGMTDVCLLHYSTVRNMWEIVEPVDVDYGNHEITAEFTDLSPVAVIANTDYTGVADTSKGTSPKTGMSQEWLFWIESAVLLAVVGILIYNRARK